MLSPGLRSFHDNVYVLTTESAADRQASVRQQLGEGDLDFVYGIDKHTVTLDEMIRSGDYDNVTAGSFDINAPEMTLGHICCAMGHRTVYETFLQSGGDRALIFEDDVVVLNVPEAKIQAAIENVPSDAELIYWGWWQGRFRPWSRISQQVIDHARYSLGLLGTNHAQIRNRYMRRYNDYYYVSARNYLLHAYTITRSAAAKMIEMNTPIIMNSDHVPIRAIANADVRGYVARTQLFGQRSRDPNDPTVSLTGD